MRVLCIGRHRFISEHLGRLLTDWGIEAATAVGFDEAVRAARTLVPDVTVCDYDLLATFSLDSLEHDSLIARTPVIAVSLTRRPEEMNLLDINGIAGCLYLPTLTADAALQLLRAAASRPRFSLFGDRSQSSPSPERIA